MQKSGEPVWEYARLENVLDNHFPPNEGKTASVRRYIQKVKLQRRLRYLKLSATVCAFLGLTSTLGASLANTNISISLGVALAGIVALVTLNLVRSK